MPFGQYLTKVGLSTPRTQYDPKGSYEMGRAQKRGEVYQRVGEAMRGVSGGLRSMSREQLESRKQELLRRKAVLESQMNTKAPDVKPNLEPVKNTEMKPLFGRDFANA